MFHNKDFYIIHSTNIGNLPKILESQSLKPIGSKKDNGKNKDNKTKKTKKNRNSKYFNNIMKLI